MTSRLDSINEQRKQKLERLRARGINPYPNRYQRTHTTQEAVEQLEEQESDGRPESRLARPVSVAGRITAIRKMGKSSFVDMRDGSGKIQLLFMNTSELETKHMELFKDLDIGDIIGVEGKLLRTRTGEPTVRVQGLHPAGQVAPAPAGEVARPERYRERATASATSTSSPTPRSRRSSRCAARSSPPCGSSSTSAASSRWKRRCCSPRPAAPWPALHHPPQRPRPGLLPAHRPGAAPQAAHRGRVRQGL